MTFEALTYIDRLKQAGVDEAVARAHADALRTALGETVAAKDGRAEMKAEFASLRAEMKLIEQRLIFAGERGLIVLGIVLIAAMVALKLFSP